jgi:hypothetical protein
MAFRALDRQFRFRHVTLAFVAAFASAVAMHQWALPRIAELTDKTYSRTCEAPCLFDARQRGYTFDDAKAYLDALGRTGRDYYATWYIPIYDLAFPVTLFVFGLVFCLWMTQPERRFAVHLRPSLRLAILIVPIGLFLFDIVENASVLWMLKAYPDQSRKLVEFASMATRIKTVFVYLSLALAVALLVFGAIGWARRT